MIGAALAQEPPAGDCLAFGRDGAERFDKRLGPQRLQYLATLLSGLPTGRAGIRLHGLPGLPAILGPDGDIGHVVAALLGSRCEPVRAVLFDKSASANWSLGWHQDRTIAVQERLEVEGFGPWTVKSGVPHVEPPFAVLADMVTLRVHIDPVPVANAPLLIVPGSHRLGRIPVCEVDGVVRRLGAAACLADAGDIWLYATPILHASKAATIPSRRRVLQVDYTAVALPGGLRWRGVEMTTVSGASRPSQGDRISVTKQ